MLNRLKRGRLAKGMTQTETAKCLGVSPVAVYKWENNLSYPRPGTLKRLADLYGITVDYLLDDPDRKGVD